MYHTIDPMILETLNLNEKRMNHILDILHGRNPRTNYSDSTAAIAKKIKVPSSTAREMSVKAKSLSSERAYKSDFDNPLPEIPKRGMTIQTESHIRSRQIMSKKPRLKNSKSLSKSLMEKTEVINEEEVFQPITQRKVPKNHKTIQHSVENFERESRKQKVECLKKSEVRTQRNSLSAVRKKFNSSLAEPTPSIFPSAEQQKTVETLPSLPVSLIDRSLKSKTKQMMEDYMGDFNIKRSRSMHTLNPKDVYRVEMEALMRDLTPLDKIEEVERKMKRLKKRYNHLKKFDKGYYSKLNAHDITLL